MLGTPEFEVSNVSTSMSIRVAHLSYSDLSGGAARAAWRIHRGILSEGMESRMFVVDKRSDDPTVMTGEGSWEPYLNYAAAWLDSLPPRLEKRSDPGLRSTGWISSTIPRLLREFSPDLVQLGWVSSGVIRLEALPKIGVPVVWRLCDMWPFSGAEHYPVESDRFEEGYRKENRPTERRGFDVDRWVWRRKARYWKQWENLYFVAPSRWMKQELLKSRLFSDARVSVIPTGVDIDVFRPTDRKAARSALGLPLDESLVLFTALSATADPRKGFAELEAAMEILVSQGVKAGLVVAGANGTATQRDLGLPVTMFEATDDRSRLAQIYAAADVFVAPSLQENLANTVLEALACGIPCVAFDVGGMPDAIVHRKNGWLAEPCNPADLAAGIRWALDLADSEVVSNCAVEMIENRFTVGRQASGFADLYRQILNSDEI